MSDSFSPEEIIEDTTKGETDVSKLLGSKQVLGFTCLKCNTKSTKDATVLVHNLMYPNLKGILGAIENIFILSHFCEIYSSPLLRSIRIISFECVCIRYKVTL